MLALAVSRGIGGDGRDVLFSPFASPAARPDAKAYAAVTLESLETRTFPRLTSYERVAEPPGGWKTRDGPKPVIADFTLPDAVFVFFSDGSVREVSRAVFDRY